MIFLPYKIKFIFSLFLTGLSSGSLYLPYSTLMWLLKHHTPLIPFSLMQFLLHLTQGLRLLLFISLEFLKALYAGPSFFLKLHSLPGSLIHTHGLIISHKPVTQFLFLLKLQICLSNCLP